MAGPRAIEVIANRPPESISQRAPHAPIPREKSVGRAFAYAGGGDSMLPMRRGQAILLMVSLLAAPLSLVARGLATSAPEVCGRLCCLRAAPHAHPSEAPAEPATCHHRSLPRSDCAMKALCNHSLVFGLVSPLPPSVLEAAAFSPSLPTMRSSPAWPWIASPAGFLPAPFVPPRS